MDRKRDRNHIDKAKGKNNSKKTSKSIEAALNEQRQRQATVADSGTSLVPTIPSTTTNYPSIEGFYYDTKTQRYYRGQKPHTIDIEAQVVSQFKNKPMGIFDTLNDRKISSSIGVLNKSHLLRQIHSRQYLESLSKMASTYMVDMSCHGCFGAVYATGSTVRSESYHREVLGTGDNTNIVSFCRWSPCSKPSIAALCKSPSKFQLIVRRLDEHLSDQTSLQIRIGNFPTSSFLARDVEWRSDGCNVRLCFDEAVVDINIESQHCTTVPVQDCVRAGNSTASGITYFGKRNGSVLCWDPRTKHQSICANMGVFIQHLRMRRDEQTLVVQGLDSTTKLFDIRCHDRPLVTVYQCTGSNASSHADAFWIPPENEKLVLLGVPDHSGLSIWSLQSSNTCLGGLKHNDERVDVNHILRISRNVGSSCDDTADGDPSWKLRVCAKSDLRYGGPDLTILKPSFTSW